jgi:MFS family permease
MHNILLLLPSTLIYHVYQPRWKKTVMILAILWGTYCFTFYGSIQTVTRIFDNADGEEMDFDYAAIFISSSAELLGIYLTIQLIDRIGRVKTLTWAFLWSGFSLFLLCALDQINYVERRVLVLFAIVGRASEMSAACVTWTVTAELLSTELLSTGHSAVNAIARTAAFFSPYLVSDENSLYTVGSILLVVNLISAVTSTHLLETKGVELGKAVLIEEARSQEIEDGKAQELVSKYYRMNGEPSFA